MSETPATSGTAPVTDRRPVPRGVIPKGVQMWLMIGVAVGMVAIIMFTGHSQPTPRATPVVMSPAPGLNPDRLRDYQDRLRALDDRARAQAITAAALPSSSSQPQDDRAPRQMDPVLEERKRREYESLFAGNVVMSRRPT